MTSSPSPAAAPASPLSQLLHDPDPSSRRSPSALLLSVGVHAALIAAVSWAAWTTITPPEAKPPPRVIIAPLPPAPPPPPRGPSKAHRPRPTKPVVKPPEHELVAPTAIPSDLPEPADDEAWVEDGVPDGVPDGVVDGVPNGVMNGVIGSGLIHDLDGFMQGLNEDAPLIDVAQARLIHRVEPRYPRIGQIAGIQGMVVLEAIIATDGSVENVRVLKSIPQLDQAAIDAVLQWRFEPATRGGRAVRMRLSVTVRFTLER